MSRIRVTAPRDFKAARDPTTNQILPGIWEKKGAYGLEVYVRFEEKWSSWDVWTAEFDRLCGDVVRNIGTAFRQARRALEYAEGVVASWRRSAAR